MSDYKHLNGLLHKEWVDATAHADKRLFNKSDKVNRDREREREKERRIIYSSTIQVTTIMTNTKLRIWN